MALYRRAGSPFWWTTLTGADGKRLRVSTKETEKRAALRQEAALELQADAQSGLSSNGRRPTTLKAALALREDALRLGKKPSLGNAELMTSKTCGVPANTVGKDGKTPAKYRLGSGMFRLDGEMWLHDITPQHLQDLISHRSREGNGATTIAHELANIRAASRYAGGLNYRTPDLVSWRLPTVVQKTRYLSWAEFELVFDRLDPGREFEQVGRSGAKVVYTIDRDTIKANQMQDAQDMLVALVLCGGRWSEVAGLTWDRIHLNMGAITIFGSKTNSERMVPLPAKLLAVLTRRYAERAAGQQYVFPGKGGKKRTARGNAILRAINAVGLNPPDKVAISGKATVHSLRHTFASWVLQNGGTLPEIQNALGHTTLQMTRRYSHLDQQQTVTRLAGILDKIGETA